MSSSLLLSLAAIIIRILVIVPAFFSIAGVLDNLSECWREPWFFLKLYGLQGVFGMLCLGPYPDFIFKNKKLRTLILIVIFACMVDGGRRMWCPIYYESFEARSHQEYKADFDAAVKRSLLQERFSDLREDDNNRVIWYVQGGNYIDGNERAALTASLFAPLVIIFLRNFQYRKKEQTLTVTGTSATTRLNY